MKERLLDHESTNQRPHLRRLLRCLNVSGYWMSEHDIDGLVDALNRIHEQEQFGDNDQNAAGPKFRPFQWNKSTFVWSDLVPPNVTSAGGLLRLLWNLTLYFFPMFWIIVSFNFDNHFPPNILLIGDGSATLGVYVLSFVFIRRHLVDTLVMLAKLDPKNANLFEQEAKEIFRWAALAIPIAGISFFVFVSMHQFVNKSYPFVSIVMYSIYVELQNLTLTMSLLVVLFLLQSTRGISKRSTKHAIAKGSEIHDELEFRDHIMLHHWKTNRSFTDIFWNMQTAFAGTVMYRVWMAVFSLWLYIRPENGSQMASPQWLILVVGLETCLVAMMMFLSSKITFNCNEFARSCCDQLVNRFSRSVDVQQAVEFVKQNPTGATLALQLITPKVSARVFYVLGIVLIFVVNNIGNLNFPTYTEVTAH